MKAVTFDTVVVKRARNREASDNCCVRAVERRVEGGSLRDIRPQMLYRTDQPQTLWLMQRSEHCQPIDRFDRRIVDPNRSGELIAAVHDAMTDSSDAADVEMLRK